ncbi:MAG: hypothetical protein M3Q16_06300 [Pseudomonadota bacterium]|nr:hypothetical protein [Pseudomonadota bacterium]
MKEIGCKGVSLVSYFAAFPANSCLLAFKILKIWLTQVTIFASILQGGCVAMRHFLNCKMQNERALYIKGLLRQHFCPFRFGEAR